MLPKIFPNFSKNILPLPGPATVRGGGWRHGHLPLQRRGGHRPQPRHQLAQGREEDRVRHGASVYPGHYCIIYHLSSHCFLIVTIFQTNDNSLTITKTTELDSGSYTCQAVTELDEDRQTASLIVQVSREKIFVGRAENICKRKFKIYEKSIFC